MSTPPTVSYGAWPSPITAARLVEGAAGVSEIRADGTDVWWNEQRPSEGGRYQLVCRHVDGTTTELLPWDPDGQNRNVRTAVLEYGGGAWNVRDGVVVFSDWADQRLYRMTPGGDAVALSPEPSTPRRLRWSEPIWLDDDWLLAVRENHDPAVVAARGDAADELVAIPLDGSAATDPSRMRVLVTGPDFVHTPAAHGDTVTWISWEHPRMPWDGSVLTVGTLVRDADGAPVAIEERTDVAGGATESIVQPGFDPEGRLLWCSDLNGWWAPYRRDADGTVHALLAEPIEGEIGGPLWVGGERWWAVLDADRFVVTIRGDGRQRLAVLDGTGLLTDLPTPFTELSQVVAETDGSVLVVGATPHQEGTPCRVTVPLAPAETVVDELRTPRELGLASDEISVPEHHMFPSAQGRQAHLLYYPPTNPAVTAPAGERPPLIVMIHGGPTAAVRHRLDLAKQFWTSRGFAIADVDYGGSVGYGRPYRDLLQGAWGIVDVEDAVAAARYLANAGLVDGERLAIRGGSAGGYTTLAALCFHDTFAAGASHYGVADLSALAADTHKFESRYLDGLVGLWPDARAIYDERSPIHHTDGFDRPLLVLQGSEDEVVPPNQAEMIVAALAAKGVPHGYLLFAGEQHGFRRAENIVRALESELWFYGRVFGFTPTDDIAPVEGAVGL